MKTDELYNQFFNELIENREDNTSVAFIDFIIDWSNKLSGIEPKKEQLKLYFNNQIENIKREPDNEGFLSDISDKISKVEDILHNIFSEKRYNDNIVKNSKEFFDKLEIIKNLIVEIQSSKKKPLAETDWKVIIESYSNKIDELKNKIASIEESMDQMNRSFDGKTFNILLSTVSILAIFVAVAFAGIGSSTLLSTISLDLSEPILKNVFYLLIIGFFIYNLILMFTYFIFAIVRTDNINIKSLFLGKEKNKKLNFFEIVDIIIIVSTVITGICVAFFVK